MLRKIRRSKMNSWAKIMSLTTLVALMIFGSAQTSQARRRGTTLADWTINGTTNVPTGNLGGNIMTVRLQTINPTDPDNGALIGQAVSDNRGRWKLSVRNSPVVPVASDRIAVTSRYTTTPVTFPITIR